MSDTKGDQEFGEYYDLDDPTDLREIILKTNILIIRAMDRLMFEQCRHPVWFKDVPKIYIKGNKLHYDMVLSDSPGKTGFRDEKGEFIKFSDLIGASDANTDDCGPIEVASV